MNGTDDLKQAADGLVQIAQDKAAAAQRTPDDVHASVIATAKTKNWNPGDPRRNDNS